VVSQKTLVLCVGNSIMGDDRIGVLIGRQLIRYGLPAEVKVFDGNIDMLGLLNEITNCDELIIVDSIGSEVAPGEVVVVDVGAEKLTQRTDDMPIGSLHDVDIVLVLKLGYLLFPEKMPRKITLIGVGVKDVKPGIKLSDEVKRSVPKAIRLVTCLLKRT